jgi:hypothetical protein
MSYSIHLSLKHFLAEVKEDISIETVSSSYNKEITLCSALGNWWIILFTII